MYSPHHGPLPDSYFLMSIFGFMFGLVLFSTTPSWGFLLILFSIIMFISSFYSAVRAPLVSTHDEEIALHQKRDETRYPDTHLHHGHVKSKRYLSHHKKRLVRAHVDDENKKAVSVKKAAATRQRNADEREALTAKRRKAARKAARTRAAKKVVKKPSRKKR